DVAEGAPAADEQLASEAAEMPSPDVIQEVDTKLDLARAYDEMGDKDGARELIEEVLKEGSPSQREAAQRLLDRLG
ncbi:FimV/HubP family polar landmark protein, partial [Arthrospira platensis SPKY2]